MSAITLYQLNDGHHIPQFGLGSGRPRPKRPPRWSRPPWTSAIDTSTPPPSTATKRASARPSSRPVCRVTSCSSPPSCENADQGYDSALRAFDTSLAKLGLEQCRPHLIHWPLPEKGLFLDSWKR